MEKGIICRWQDGRGFGFIQLEKGPAVFLHVSAFAATPRRPADGDEVHFRRMQDENGKPKASWAAFASVPRQAIKARALPDNAPRPWFALLFCIVLCVLYVKAFVSREVLMLYALISVLTMVMYHRDKKAALRNGWRTPESALHWVALLGGWPGAMLAQYGFRHKSTKVAFRRWFYVTVAANITLLVVLVYQWQALLALLR